VTKLLTTSNNHRTNHYRIKLRELHNRQALSHQPADGGTSPGSRRDFRYLINMPTRARTTPSVAVL
jgi:hypothetical protein